MSDTYSAESVAQEEAEDVEEETKVEVGLEKNEETGMVTVVTVTDPEIGTGGVDVGGGDGDVSGFLMSKKEKKWCKVLLGVRISACVLCLKAFAVLAADKQNVVAVQSVYSFYPKLVVEAFRWYYSCEFKYCFAINVIGFVYSGLQISDLLKYMITKKRTVNPRIRGYFTVVMDQALAYLLMSSSSSAATTIHIFRSYWLGFNAYKFTDMASASVVLSFLAFGAFALASIISGFILCRFT